MHSKAKLSLLQIEQEVETQAKEWQRQRLQSRLQQLADEQGAISPETGEALQEARYESVTLDTCAGMRSSASRHEANRPDAAHRHWPASAPRLLWRGCPPAA